jgi:hypothetical protein
MFLTASKPSDLKSGGATELRQDNAIQSRQQSCFNADWVTNPNGTSGLRQLIAIESSRITMAFTGLRSVEARKTQNPPAATPVQRFVMPYL